MNRLIVTLAAVLVGTGLAFAPAAFAQGMTKSDTPMSKPDDKMGKGTKTGEKDGMKKGEMGKKSDETSGGMKK